MGEKFPERLSARWPWVVGGVQDMSRPRGEGWRSKVLRVSGLSSRLLSGRVLLLLLVSLPWQGVGGEELWEVSLNGSPSDHELSWLSNEDTNYQVEQSLDLVNWADTGVTLPGTGASIGHPFAQEEEDVFYRIRSTPDVYGGSFLTLPLEGQERDTVDGVCIAFDLNLLPQAPAKIRLYRRVYGSGDPWEMIGVITEFAEVSGLRFVRGNVVWVPETEGEYELQAAVIDSFGAVIGSAVRRVVIGANLPPTTTITGGPASSSSAAVPAIFTTTVVDADVGDTVRRVDFFDNGVLIGSDDVGPDYGDFIRDAEGESYALMKGLHSITARAYDSRGGEGPLSPPYLVEVTAGNTRPTVEVTSPLLPLTVLQGQVFTVSYTFDDLDGVADVSRVSAYDIVTGESVVDLVAPFEDLVLDTTGWALGTHVVRVKVTDQGGESSYPAFLRIIVRAGTGPTFAETLIANLVDEATATPSGESFAGVEESTSQFSSGVACGLQLDSGVVLTTGAAFLWNNGDLGNGIDENDYLDGNNEPVFQNFEEAGDRELELRVAGARSFDAASLEFDVFCVNGQLEFEYQFGSEEYDEYVTQYNDAFMLTVDGVVVSFVPDCSSIVSVNNVHPVEPNPSNVELFLDDDDDIKPLVDPAHLTQQVEYDGMTIKLRGHVLVEPGKNHRVKLVIADITDDQWDSALFVESGSIRTRVVEP